MRHARLSVSLPGQGKGITEQPPTRVVSRGASAVEGVRRHVHLTGKVILKGAAVLVVFVALGNLTILAASMWAQRTTSTLSVASLRGIENLQAVDARVWRGGAPSPEGYRSLARSGVTTVIDLRAEEGIEAEQSHVRHLGMDLVRIPIRDGQTPKAEQVEAMLKAVREAPGLVFIHCGAGVGRTGTMVGAYLVAQGEANSRGALRRNLAVGPPSLEQVAFVANLSAGSLERPNALLTATSRVLDAPRRIWSRIS